MTERIRLEVEDEELEAVINRLDEAILKKAELVTGVSVSTQSRALSDVEAQAQALDAYVDMAINEAVAQIITVKQEAVAVNRDVLAMLLETEVRTKSLQEQVRGLPTVDRATRMILLRIPGIREVLRLIYIVKMEERTLRLGQIASTAKIAEINIAATIAELSGGLVAVEVEAVAVEVSVQATINRLTAEIQAVEAQASTSAATLRGGFTVIVTLLMYTMMAIQQIQRQQERVEARMRAMEKDMDLRMISMEEAVREYGALPERYRSTVVPG